METLNSMKIGVIGAGTMGAGIAQVFAENGYTVIIKEVQEELYQRGLKNIEKILDRGIKKEKITEADKATTLSHLTGTTDVNDLADCDLIVEAAVENMKIKKLIFEELDKVCKPEAILATNTSSLSITDVAISTNRPEKVIGMHFFNPVPVMKLVEIIKGISTSEATVATVLALAQSLGKEAVKVEEAPGFVVNRILIPMINEAVGILADGVAQQKILTWQ